ncbi:hypothetical protein KEM48_012391 [Puccinia striiformis f. sp. tritici PST-130]|uniref:Uncharacterized protein n=1 Tax=Puccinia striiformis f. sp. tritici PST-78 TaxID=1165861 RepID=A0A0L0W2S9_9BASI|nr:hypothetical protein KEM48_012391 [Puccinia striiformis f. sp. tritici PST-130]KNF05777.1 hypothetical protein PSTG_01174 [Puccinia striiformis f. sp. tritici PST-78]
MTSSSHTPHTPWTTRQIAWDCDGDEGHPPSITVLLNWLKRDNNYARWRQDTTKVTIRWEVVAELNTHGIGHRNGADVNLKICMLEQACLSARAIQSQPDIYKRIIDGEEISTEGGFLYFEVCCHLFQSIESFAFLPSSHADDLQALDSAPPTYGPINDSCR